LEDTDETNIPEEKTEPDPKKKKKFDVTNIIATLSQFFNSEDID